MTDWTESEAWARGIAEAERQLALQPPADGAISVTLNRYPERTSYTMCLLCHRERGSMLCPHGAGQTG